MRWTTRSAQVVQLGQSGPDSDWHFTSPDLGTFNFFKGSGWWREQARNVSADAVDSLSVPRLAQFAQVQVQITGSVAITTGSQSLVGTSTHFTTELHVGSLIKINWGNTTIYSVISITDNTHLQIGVPFVEATVSGVPIFRRYAPVTVTNGSDQVVAVVSGQAYFGRDYPAGSSIQIPGDNTRFYHVESVEDNDHLTLLSPYQGTTASGVVPTTGGTLGADQSMAYNVFPDDQAMVAYGFGPSGSSFPTDLDPAQIPFDLNMSLENQPAYGVRLVWGASSTDSHGFVALRSSDAASIKSLHEVYNAKEGSSAFKAAHPGVDWEISSVAVWDLNTGAPRRDGVGATDAAGLAVLPLCLRYPELAHYSALGEPIPHAIRFTIPGGYGGKYYVFPARCLAEGGNSGSNALHLGSRLRISQEWYDWKKSSYTGLMRTLLDTLREYGLILADWGGTYFQCVRDDRFYSDLNSFNIPIYALEVCDTVHPSWSLTGPTTGIAGQPLTYTVQYTRAANSNFQLWCRLYHGSGSQAGVSPSYQPVGDPDFYPGWTRGPVVFTFTPPSPGTYNLYLGAATQGGWLPATLTLTVATPITSAWRTVNAATYGSSAASGPWVLDQANTRYQLTENLTATGTGFVVLAANVTLDLNGYTITYGNSAPLTVTNGGFETGAIGATTIAGWDLTGASAAAIAANTNYLFGSQVLRLSSFSTTQTITSNSISIPAANHAYTATITPAGITSNASVTLSVIDTVTGLTLGSASSANVQRGFSAVVTFVPATTNAVRLRVVVTPTTTPDTLDLDRTTLTASHDYGIIDSRAYYSDMGAGHNNLPPGIQSAYNAGRMNAASFTVRNGRIAQGQGAGFSSSPLYGQYASGITVDSVQTSDSGDDTTTVDLGNMVGGGATITNSTFTQSGTNVTNRMYGPSTLALSGTTGAVLVQGNTISGSLQKGIALSGIGPSVIDNNQISQNAMVPDAAAIMLVSVQNFRVTNNTITPTAGEGIMIDGYAAQPSNLGVIQDNIVTTQETPNREMGIRTQARALRLRNDVDAEGPHTNIDISGNTFTTTIGPGKSSIGYAVWITYVNNNDAMDNAGVSLHDNTIELINESSDLDFAGCALLVDGMAHGINLTIENNILSSNDTSLSIGGYNSEDVYDLTLLSNTLSKSSSGASRSYVGITAGYLTSLISNVKAIDIQLANGATSAIAWTGTGTKDIEVGWLLSVTVRNSDSSLSVGSTVEVRDKDSALVYSGTTNSSGLLANIPVVTTVHAQTTSDPGVITTTAQGPFSVAATSPLGHTASVSGYAITGNQNLTLTLNGVG